METKSSSMVKPMKPDELRQKLEGVIAFPVTPFKKDLSLDLKGLQRNLQEILRHPIAAVVAPAGTGEFFSLTIEEHLEVVETTVGVVDGKVPVLAAVGFNLPMARQLVQQSDRAGVDGLLGFPPYYPQAADEGLINYYQKIAAATRKGFIIYSRDWMNASPELVRKLTAIPNLIAWKDGQGDLRRYQAIIGEVGDRLKWIGGAGDDLVPGYYSLGIRTYTSSIANIAPEISWQLHDLASGGHSRELDQLMKELVIPLYQFRNRRKGYEVSAMKWMMDQIGLVGGPVRPPLLDVRKEDQTALRQLTNAFKKYL